MLINKPLVEEKLTANYQTNRQKVSEKRGWTFYP